MPVKRAKTVIVFGFGVAVVAQGCGARSQIDPCVRDSDCANIDLCATFACVYSETIHDKECTRIALTNCDDGNPCTTDSCDESTGGCVNTWLTFDLDGDGHRGPLPGFAPGTPGSCGDDCDDTDPRAFPGNPEVCDGVDNDCDGIIDNGATYIPTLGSEFQLSTPGFDWAEPGSLTRGTKGLQILATYSASSNGQFSPYLQPLDQTGQPTVAPAVLTGTAAAGSNTSVAWTGDRYGISWSDRRDGNFEVYFALLDPTGKKMAPGDERITVSQGFSLYPSVVWTGQEFAIAWQEEKDDGTFMIQGQRIALDGSLIGNIATLTVGSFDDQGPSLASGISELGLVWVRQPPTGTALIAFQPIAFDLTVLPDAPKPASLTTPAMGSAYPSISYDHKNDRYAVAFYDPSPTKRVVYGAIVGKNETIITPATNVSESPAQARDPTLFAFGDRVLFIYADDQDGTFYQLYAREMSADLTTALEPQTPVTAATGDCTEPLFSFASDGTVLVLFRDDQGPDPAVFETGLKCNMPATTP